MSSLPLHEADYPPDILAEELDQKFNDIALNVPQHVKFAGRGENIGLYQEEGVGKLSAEYIGNFTITVIMEAEGYEGQLNFWKDYALRDYHLARGGVPYEIEKTNPDDLLNCPAPLPVFAQIVEILHEGFMKQVNLADAPGAKIYLLNQAQSAVS